MNRFRPTPRVMTLNVSRVTVVEREHGTDIVTIYTDMPPGCPALDESPATLSMDVRKGDGADYVRRNWGMEPEIINTEWTPEQRDARRFSRDS